MDQGGKKGRSTALSVIAIMTFISSIGGIVALVIKAIGLPGFLRAAGPGANVAIALGLMALFALARSFGVPATSDLLQIAVNGIFINALLAVFNLIPIPPLDGSRVVQYFLPPSALTIYLQFERFGLLIIVALLLFAPQIQQPLLAAVTSLITAMATLFGVQAQFGEAPSG